MRRLLIFPGALGDLCLLAAALAARADALVLCVQRALVPAARMLMPAAEIGPPMDGAAMSSLFGENMDPSIEQRLRAADRIDAWLRRADRDGALSRRLAGLGVPFFLHELPRGDAPRHASVDYALALGGGAGVGVAHAVAPPPSVPLPWRRSGVRRLVLHPGAGAPGKAWEREGFRRVAAAWEDAGGELVVLLGPAEDAQADAWDADGRSPLRDLGIADAAALVASAGHWLGNDSGMSHLAGALARDGVVVFTETRADRWRPLGGRLVPIETAGRTLATVVSEVCARLDGLDAAP